VHKSPRRRARIGCTRVADFDQRFAQEKTHQWLQELLESLSQSSDSSEFSRTSQGGSIPGRVYVFTPKGRISRCRAVRRRWTSRTSVHTDIGNRCISVKVNHGVSPCAPSSGTVTEWKSSRVQCQTESGLAGLCDDQQGAQPHPAFPQNHAIRRVRRKLGERLLNQALHALGIKPQDMDEAHWNKLLKEPESKRAKKSSPTSAWSPSETWS